MCVENRNKVSIDLPLPLLLIIAAVIFLATTIYTLT